MKKEQMEELAYELADYLKWLGFPAEVSRSRKGGFLVSSKALVSRVNEYGKNVLPYNLKKDFEDIQTKLTSPSSRITTLQDKLTKFQTDTLFLGGMKKILVKGFPTPVPAKTLEDFKAHQEGIKNDDASSVGSSIASADESSIKTMSLEDDLVSGMNKLTLDVMTLEQARAKAMERARVEEKLDKSDIYFKGDLSTRQPELNLLEATGRGAHNQYGERHLKAKLTNAQATEIRRRWWVNKEPQIALAREYGVADPTINNVIKRETWSHLPQVEGEPDEIFNAPNATDKNVLAKAKKLGIEPVRNKIGRLALPADAVLKLKAEKKIKAKE